MSDKIVMGYWDCPFCQTKKIKGTLQDCPSCGATRTKDVKFYMDAANVEYLSEEKAATKRQGADWMCTWCRSFNPATAKTCKNCGAERDEKSYDYFERQQQKEENKALQPVTFAEEPAPEKKPLPPSRLLMLVVLLFGLIAGFIWLLIPKTKTLTVSGVSWNCNIEIEKYKEVEEDDWSLPEGGTLIRTNSEIHHYDQVLDHYERVERTREVLDGYDESTSYSDNGDGTYTEHTSRTPRYRTETYYDDEPVYVSVPVYRTKYYYTIWRWKHERDVATSGNDKNPYYGTVTLGENEREGAHSEEYHITGYTKKNGKEKTYDISAELWEEMQPDHSYRVKIKGSKILELK